MNIAKLSLYCVMSVINAKYVLKENTLEYFLDKIFERIFAILKVYVICLGLIKIY